MLLNGSSRTPLTDAIKREVRNKKRNFTICIVGKPQMRKSTTAISISLDLNPRFKLGKHLAIIKARAMLRVLKVDQKRGIAVIVLDELGVGMNHRRWFDFLNQALSYVMQTFGFRRIILIITVPYEDYVDKDARKLFDMLIEIVDKNDDKRYVIAKVQEIQYNAKLKRIYYKYPRARMRDGSIKKVERIKIQYPSKEIMKEYFEMSIPIKVWLHDELEKEADRIEKDKIHKYFDPKELAREVLEDIEPYTIIVNYQKQISKDLIATEKQIGDRRAKQVRAYVEKQLGWDRDRPVVEREAPVKFKVKVTKKKEKKKRAKK